MDRKLKLQIFQMAIMAHISPRRSVQIVHAIEENESYLRYLPDAIEITAVHIINLISREHIDQKQTAILEFTREATDLAAVLNKEVKAAKALVKFDGEYDNRPFYHKFYKKNRRGYRR